MRSLPRAVAATLTVVLVACTGTTRDAAEPSTSPPTSEATMTEHTPTLARVVAQAVADLARRLDVPADAITVVSADEVSWGDTSLGCPQPGMRYAQVVTDGTKVVLSHDGTTYPYHSGGSRTDPFLCDWGMGPGDPASTPPDPGKGLITDPAY